MVADHRGSLAVKAVTGGQAVSLILAKIATPSLDRPKEITGGKHDIFKEKRRNSD